MDLDKLRKISQEGRDNLEKEVLRRCNPQEIALKLINDLENKAIENAKVVIRNAEVDFTIYYWTDYNYTEGPFVNVEEPLNVDEMTKILFEMVKKHISDNDIQLSLENVKNERYEYIKILASVSW
jgi:hypothetical protein